MKFLFLLIGLALFVGSLMLGWSFASNNETPVHLDLIWLQVSGLALWQVLLAALGLGATLASIVLGFALVKSKMIARRFRKMVTKLEKEVHELRSLPLVGSDPDGSALDAAPNKKGRGRKADAPSVSVSVSGSDPVAGASSSEGAPASPAATPAPAKARGRFASAFRSGSTAKKS